MSYEVIMRYESVTIHRQHTDTLGDGDSQTHNVSKTDTYSSGHRLCTDEKGITAKKPY